MAFSERLQEVRRRAGLTQEQFAEDLQVSRQAVSKWESGRGYPEIEKLLYICEAYNVTLNDLFEQETAGKAEHLPRRHFGEVLSGWFSNLSPRHRAQGIGVLLGVALLSLIIGLILRGGTWEMNVQTIIWAAAMVIFGITEAATAGLVSIWFVAGSLAGFVCACCGGPIYLQVVLFFVVSIVALVATRPLVKKFAGSVAPTNADRVLGMTARVTETVDNAVPSGAVYIDGKTWSARSETGEVIPLGTMVTAVRMEGVKLYVKEEKS